MGGGVGSRFGEGESQLEVDRRMVRKRITTIKRELEQLRSVRSLQRESRFSSGMFKVALAGYTNAGKSSLLNRLTDADVLSYDKLFATLDSTTRRYKLPEGREITLTDTVGFIQKLPTTLVEAFKSTLDEITGADLILHVIDSSSDEYDAQIRAVEEVLDQIEAHDIPCIKVFNKIDALDADSRAGLEARHAHDVLVSAKTGEGIRHLVKRIELAAASSDAAISVLIPYREGRLVSLAHQRCRILNEEHSAEGTLLSMMVPAAYLAQFEPFRIETE